jgi:hypothetical protein
MNLFLKYEWIYECRKAIFFEMQGIRRKQYLTRNVYLNYMNVPNLFVNIYILYPFFAKFCSLSETLGLFYSSYYFFIFYFHEPTNHL